MFGIIRAGFLDDVLPAIEDKIPGAAVPMIEPRKTEDTRAFDIKRHAGGVTELKKIIRCVVVVVASQSVVSAAHVRSLANTLVGPVIPKTIAVQANGNSRRLLCVARVNGKRRKRDDCQRKGTGKSNKSGYRHRLVLMRG